MQCQHFNDGGLRNPGATLQLIVLIERDRSGLDHQGSPRPAAEGQQRGAFGCSRPCAVSGATKERTFAGVR